MKTCYICKEKKELDEFHKDRTQSGGLSYDCKKCKSETRKQKRKENPEKYREQNRKSRLKNYERIVASQKRHLIENREAILKRRKERREPRKVEINLKESKRRKKQRQTNPEYVKRERERARKNYWKNRETQLPKHYAHKMVMYAIKLGMMKRPSACEVCGSGRKVEGHHEDYTKPLDVRWLCKVCHVAVHQGKACVPNLQTLISPQAP